MPHTSKSPAACHRGRAGKQFQNSNGVNFIAGQSIDRNSYAARVIIKRFGLPLSVAALIAELAGLGVVHG